MRFQGKVAAVTGAARGIGRACADAFAAEGARVAVVDVNGEAAEAAAAQIKSQGHDALAVACDVGDKASVTAMVETVARELGPIDALSHNAGISISGDFLDLDEAAFDEVIRVNLKGTFLVGQAVARNMVANSRKGAIVNMSSINAVVTIPSIVPYVASKGGVAQVTKAMALALADHGIRVNAVGPGSIDTEMLKNVNSDPDAKERIMSRTPVKRLGAPAEIADVVLYLASDQSSYVNGVTIYADGGRLALNYTV